MKRIDLPGIDGSNPLGFLAALGLLRIVPEAKLGFSNDGSFQAFFDEFDKEASALAEIVAQDAIASADPRAPWRFSYEKAATKKQGPQIVADLKPPPADFRRFLTTCLDLWMTGYDEPAAYASAYATDVAVDGKGNTKPTAFHFTAAQQTFLGAVEGIRASVNVRWAISSMFEGHGDRPGSNLRWSPDAERNWALLAGNPADAGTRVDAPLEWLAFRGLPLLPSFPRGTRIVTTGVSGRGDDMTFSWPLWSTAATLQTIRSVLQIGWSGAHEERSERGIFAICTSDIRRTSQGFGNFGPSVVS